MFCVHLRRSSLRVAAASPARLVRAFCRELSDKTMGEFLAWAGRLFLKSIFDWLVSRRRRSRSH
jgi:hypothetical protein